MAIAADQAAQSSGGGSALLTALAVGGVGGAALAVTRSLAKVGAAAKGDAPGRHD